jgi:hypothetical protein
VFIKAAFVDISKCAACHRVTFNFNSLENQTLGIESRGSGQSDQRLSVAKFVCRIDWEI